MGINQVRVPWCSACLESTKHHHVSRGARVHKNCWVKADWQLPGGMSWHHGHWTDIQDEPWCSERKDSVPTWGASVQMDWRSAAKHPRVIPEGDIVYWHNVCQQNPNATDCVLGPLFWNCGKPWESSDTKCCSCFSKSPEIILTAWILSHEWP
jgi:hypothetical protein